MSDPDDFGDVSYTRLKKWQHSPRVLIRQSIKYSLRYFGASIIQCDIRDQNIINEAVKNLCIARGINAGAKMNIKKLAKLNLEINFSKLIIHTHPPTALELSQILFCEKLKLSNDTKGFQYLAFVANVDSQNTAFIFVCSHELALEIYRTYTQLCDMNIMHTNCTEIRNAITRVGCGTETGKQVQELWQSRDEMFRDAVYKIQSHLTRQFPLLDESLEKLAKTEMDKDLLKEHTKLINELKQSLIQTVRHAQSVTVDSSVLMSQQLETYLNPRSPSIKPPISPIPSKEQKLLDFPSTPKSVNQPTSSNTYETPRQIPSPRSPCPQLPNTPIPQIPVAFRTLPTRSVAHKKSPTKTLFNTLKPKPRTKFGNPAINATDELNFNHLSFSNNETESATSNNNQPSTSTSNNFLLEKDSDQPPKNSPHESNYYESSANQPATSTESNYYEGQLNQPKKLSESDYYEGTLRVENTQPQPEDPYYYCPMPVGQVSPRSNNELPSIRVTIESTETGSESQSESSQRNSVRDSRAFEDEDPESIYISHQC